MKRAVPLSFLGSEFDAFLYASIDENLNGVPLSVLSALARLDVDPWEEAARLARLPKKTAARQLASLLAQIPTSQVTWQEDLGQIVPRLIALLPTRPAVMLAAFDTLPLAASIRAHRAASLILLLYTIYVALLLLASAFNS